MRQLNPVGQSVPSPSSSQYRELGSIWSAGFDVVRSGRCCGDKSSRGTARDAPRAAGRHSGTPVSRQITRDSAPRPVGPSSVRRAGVVPQRESLRDCGEAAAPASPGTARERARAAAAGGIDPARWEAVRAGDSSYSTDRPGLRPPLAR